MHSSKKFISHIFSVVIFYLFFYVPNLAMCLVFDRVAAKVNNEIITLSSVQERVEVLKAKYQNNKADFDDKKILIETLEMMVAEKLKIQEGKKMELLVEDSAVEAALVNIEKNNGLEEGQLKVMLESEGRSLEAYKNHIRDQILISKITRFELGRRITISDRKILKYYQANQKDYWEEVKIKVRHILILLDKEASSDKKNESYKHINGILSEIKNGKDFSDAAVEYSEDVSASSGGDVGYIEKGKMVPEFEKVVYSLKEGEISNVVETEFGFHIIKVDEIRPGRTLPLNEVKDKIKNILSVEKQKSAYAAWVKELRETAFIEISLFDEPENNTNSDMIASRKPEKTGEVLFSERELSQNNRDDSRKKTKKEKMEARWIEMYKSVEKTKNRTSGKSISSFQTLEEKLIRIKELRSQEKITEAEYQKRKEELLETTGKSISSFQTLEEKLLEIKDLWSQEKITEAEYQKRKQLLLDDL